MAKKQIVEDTEETASKSFEENSMEVIKSLQENRIDKFRSRFLVDGGKPLVIGRDGRMGWRMMMMRREKKNRRRKGRK